MLGENERQGAARSRNQRFSSLSACYGVAQLAGAGARTLDAHGCDRLSLAWRLGSHTRRPLPDEEAQGRGGCIAFSDALLPGLELDRTVRAVGSSASNGF